MLNIHKIHKCNQNATGYMIRERRNLLNLSAQKLSELSDVSKSNILKAERGEMHLSKLQLQKVGNVLSVDVNKLIDFEYNHLYNGYNECLNNIIEKIGIKETSNLLNVTIYTLESWINRHTTPNYKNRKNILEIYSNF